MYDWIIEAGQTKQHAAKRAENLLFRIGGLPIRLASHHGHPAAAAAMRASETEVAQSRMIHWALA